MASVTPCNSQNQSGETDSSVEDSKPSTSSPDDTLTKSSEKHSVGGGTKKPTEERRGSADSTTGEEIPVMAVEDPVLSSDQPPTAGTTTSQATNRRCETDSSVEESKPSTSSPDDTLTKSSEKHSVGGGTKKQTEERRGSADSTNGEEIPVTAVEDSVWKSDQPPTTGTTTSQATNRRCEQGWFKFSWCPRGKTLWFGAFLICVAAWGFALKWKCSVSPSENTVLNQTEMFLREMEKLKEMFPGQRSEMWRRSRIHLERHLRTVRPTEPVSIILTAGSRGEKTLRCLASRLASAFASALNASVLHIDGGKAGQDSDRVKLDIDSKLQGAFQGDKPVAVIHRFEELPPGSTLIFYRYCDHENAAYKKVLIIFTVLLKGKEELPASLGLTDVEEMVDDHLKDHLVSSGQPAAYDTMDLDKYGGLWSRISHLVLPVAAESSVEQGGCV